MNLFLFTESVELTQTISECVSKLNHHHQLNVETYRNTDMRILDEKKVRNAIFIIDESYRYDQEYFLKNIKKHTLTFLIGETVIVLRPENTYEQLPFDQFLLRLENYIYLKLTLAKEV